MTVVSSDMESTMSLMLRAPANPNVSASSRKIPPEKMSLAFIERHAFRIPSFPTRPFIAWYCTLAFGTNHI